MLFIPDQSCAAIFRRKARCKPFAMFVNTARNVCALPPARAGRRTGNEPSEAWADLQLKTRSSDESLVTSR